MKVLGIAGSLRRDSWNRKVLEAAAELLPRAGELEVWDGLKAVPPYDEDDDVQPAPAAVAELRRAIAEADAILFSTPEYNGSIPGQLKNSIDWASRPFTTSVLRNKPVAVVGATPGTFGAVWAQADLRKVLARTGARVAEVEVPISRVHERFDADGTLDDQVRSQLRDAVEALVEVAQPRVPVAA
jgi:chromate reductase, NAD(P)H dehydrogenase (quinone)